LPSPPLEPPSVSTAGDTDTPINDAPPPTPRVTFRECPARPPPTVPSRTNSPVHAPTGQDPMDLAVDGGPAPTTPPSGKGSTEVDLITPRQPPPAGPSTRPGTTLGFGGPLPLEEPSPSPAPFTRRVRPGNEETTRALSPGSRASPCPSTSVHHST